MIKQTHTEWLDELLERAHGDKRLIRDVAFECPHCGRQQTMAEFAASGIEPQRAYVECIGRHVETMGCDWAAYGLLRTLGKGRVLTLEDGSTVEVFDFGALVLDKTLAAA